MEKLIIDVSEHQGYIDWYAVKPKIDGVIIRCGYGDDDADQDDKRWKYNVAQCEKLGIPYGVYLYSYANTDAHAKSEAAHALRLLKGHKPQYPVYIDLEEGSYGGYAVRCADIFCKAIKEAGYIPGVYTFESFYNSFMDGYDKYTLWIAKYGVNDGKPHSKPNISKPYDAWQFSSMYYMRGYSDRLDVSYFYKDFSGSSTPTPAPAPEPVKKISRANVAAQIMEHLCTCPEHGYSQPGRKGTSGYCTVQTDIGAIKVKKGDRDCSSAVCESWQLAIKATPYEGKLDGATYTGNMESVFLDSGLFVKWNTATTEAVRGDVYLVHNSSRQHTAMCLDGGHDGVYGYDALGEFSIAETGDIDGVPGDQTGWESSIHEWYDFATVTLHYNGKADSEVLQPTPTPTPTPTPSYTKGKYKVLVNNLNVRAKASTASQSVAKYQKGQTLIADKVVNKNGYYWASYIGRSSGKRRYVAIAKADGSKKYMKHV